MNHSDLNQGFGICSGSRRFCGLLSTTVAWITVWLLLNGSQVNGQSLIDFVRDAHRASRDKIRTCSCQIYFKMTGKNKDWEQWSRGRFWGTPDALRARISDQSGAEIDYVWKDSVRNVVMRRPNDNKANATANRQDYTHRHQIPCDPWTRALLVLERPDTKNNVNFEELLEKPTRIAGAERIEANGKEQIVVTLHFDGRPEKGAPWNTSWKMQVFFDPAVNYLVRKVIYSAEERNFSRGEDVVQFKEMASGIFFPERTTGWCLDRGKPYSESVTEISDIRINQAIPADVFTSAYPPGAVVVDTIKGSRYTVDAAGNPISKQTALGRGAPQQGTTQSKGVETTEETSNAPWILVLSLTILAAVGIAFLLHRWTSRKHAQGG